MIVINEIPIRSDYRISHIINEDILTVTIDGIEEEFDFTGMPDGVLEDIEVDFLPLNPILNAIKELGVLTIDLCRFYSFEEKYLFEEGVEPPVEETEGEV